MSSTLSTPTSPALADAPGAPVKLRTHADVSLKTLIPDASEIVTAANVRIENAVEAALIIAEGNIDITGGILGKHTGKIQSGKNISAKFCDAAYIMSGGDVLIETQSLHSDINARGALNMPNGNICGGHIAANGGITCRTIGTAAGAATEVGAGFHLPFNVWATAELKRLSAILEHARSVRARLAPLMQRQKSLAHAQREKAIELLYEAGEAENQANQTLAQMKVSLLKIAAVAQPRIIVTEMLHPNVTLHFPGLQTVTKMALQGPLKIIPHTSQSNPMILVTKIESGKTYSLPASVCEDPAADVRTALEDTTK